MKGVTAYGLICFWAIIIIPALGQAPDLQEKQIMAMPDDTAKVNRLNELAAKMQFEYPTQAIAWLETAHHLATQLQYDLGRSVALIHRSTLFFYEVRLDTAKVLMAEAYALVKDKTDMASRKHLALIIQRYAAYYQQMQKYDSAVLMYQDAAKRFTELRDPTKAIVCYYNLSTIYNSLADSENAIRYARETRAIALVSGDSTYMVRSYIALADAFAGAGNYDSLYASSIEGLAIANRLTQLFPVGKFQLLLGIYYEHHAEFDSAIHYYTSAYKAFHSINLGYETSLALYHIGHAHLQNQMFTTAIDYLKQALAKSKNLKLDQVMRMCLVDLANAEEQLGNFKESHRYLRDYIRVNDTIAQRNNRKLVYDLEAKYQNEKKEAQLLLQENQLKQQSLLNYLLAIAVVSIAIIAFFMYYTFKQRRILQEKRIQELEKQKLLSASEAIIQGQDQERGRLAKDLHDGLGGLLSGIKYSLTNMKSNVVLDANHALAFERTLDMLDHSIAELRRVAHNMMPEVLVRFGLEEAVKSYCDSIRQSGIFQVDFQAVGTIQRLDSNKEIIVYRIIQELLNNSAKHANANHVLVQLAFYPRELSVTVEDNGLGFETDKLNQNTGSGWTSIRSRMDYLKGKVDVQSGVGKGTSVQLTIPT